MAPSSVGPELCAGVASINNAHRQHQSCPRNPGQHLSGVSANVAVLQAMQGA